MNTHLLGFRVHDGADKPIKLIAHGNSGGSTFETSDISTNKTKATVDVIEE
jgi:hypothetical protein